MPGEAGIGSPAFNLHTISHSPSPFTLLMNQGAIAWFEGDSQLAYLTDSGAYDDKIGLKAEEKEGVGIMW
jgi:hypothetical protein